MSVQYFTKKPLTVAAVLWSGDNLDEVRAFVGDALIGGDRGFGFRLPDLPVDPLDGEVWNREERCMVRVPVGHWVVRGALGEFYPVSPAALERTFEPADGVA